MKISYAIPVCNEHVELRRLLTLLLEAKREQDEIVVQFDEGNTTHEVMHVLHDYNSHIKVVGFPLKGNFAAFKNNLKSNCFGDWIFQIDADELLHKEFINALPEILQENPAVELFCLPRINTVEGLTEEHVRKWGWKVNERGWVNFPDIQTRIIQNSPRIQWAGKVHEVITGQRNHAVLPLDEIYCILHNKDIARQEIQNNYYNSF